MIKKHLLLILLSVCVCGTISGCGGSTVENKKSTNGNHVSSYNSRSLSENKEAGSDDSENEASENSDDSIDPFKGLEVVFTGTSPYAQASINTANCSDEINEQVIFNADKKSGLRNGDEITVTAELKQLSSYNRLNSEVRKRITLSQKSKSFTVNVASELITSIDGLNLKDIQKELEDKLASVTAANENGYRFAGEYLDHAFISIESKRLKSKYFVAAKKQYEMQVTPSYNNNAYNKYVEIYDFLIKLSDGNKTHVYVLVYAKNLFKDENGKISWDINLENASNTNYDNLINDQIVKLREYYNISEIKS